MSNEDINTFSTTLENVKKTKKKNNMKAVIKNRHVYRFYYGFDNLNKS